MITAIIRNKENTLVLELPHSIYDIYEKLQSIGIILDDDRCHIAHFDILNHFLKRRTVEIRAGITVVHIETGITEAIFFGVFLQ